MRLSDKILKLLNRQVAREYSNHLQYQDIRSWAAYNGLDGLVKLFAKQASGEIEHVELLSEFIFARDGELDLSDLKAPPIKAEYLNIDEVFQAALTTEMDTTEMIKDIVTAAEAELDFQTMTWLFSDMLPEQLEEEALFYTITARLNGYAEAPGRSHEIDEYIAELVEDEDEYK